MNPLKHFEKKDIISYSSLIIIFLVLLIIFWKYQGSIIMDCPNEAYIPQEILKGKILYKDFYYGYGPFTYLFNCLLFILFSQNILVLYLAGAATAIIIISSLYLISRNFTSPFESFIICLLIISLCMFNNHYRNVSYIFPYTYSILYALCFFILSVLFSIYYLRRGKTIYALLSLLFVSLSLISKYEFFFYSLFLLLLILFISPIAKKHYLNCLIALFSPPLICIAILYLQGLTFNDMLVNLEIVYKFSHSPVLHHFYQLRGTLPTWEYFFKTLVNFITFSIFFIICFSIIYYFQIKINLLKSNFLKHFLTLLIILLCILYSTLTFLDDPYKDYMYFQVNSSWLPLSSLLILICLCAYQLIKNKTSILNLLKSNYSFKNVFMNLFELTKNKHFLFIFLIICAILASIKTFTYSNFNHIGAYLTILNIVVLVVFLTQYLPKISTKIDLSVWKQTCYIILVLISINCIIINYLITLTIQIDSISTSRGTMYGASKYVKPLHAAFDYINNNLTKEATLLVLPRCTSLNFLTNRTTNTKHINVDPIIMDTIGENNIVEDFKIQPADYIIVTTEDLHYFDKPLYFGEHYGFDICNYIKQNYKFVKSYGTDFKLFLFKKNTLRKKAK